MHFAGRILCRFLHEANFSNLPYCPYCGSCFIYLDLLLTLVAIVYGVRIKFYRHRVNGRPKWHFFMLFSNPTGIV